MAALRHARSSAVISSASISFNRDRKGAARRGYPPCHHVAPDPADPRGGHGRSAAIGRASAHGDIVCDVAYAVAQIRSLTVKSLKLTLKYLAAPANRTERIASDDIGGGIRGHHVAPAGSYFIGERFVDPFVRCIGRFCLIDQLTKAVMAVIETTKPSESKVAFFSCQYLSISPLCIAETCDRIGEVRLSQT